MPDQENVKDPSAHPLISSSPLPTLSTSSPFLRSPALPAAPGYFTFTKSHQNQWAFAGDLWVS